ncbi:MAG: hypothetical protein GY722_02935 [bacterium]|nr:hypothetical protein [bacterium]
MARHKNDVELAVEACEGGGGGITAPQVNQLRSTYWCDTAPHKVTTDRKTGWTTQQLIDTNVDAVLAGMNACA